VEFKLDLCSLFHGCVEPVNITRRVFDEHNQCTELTKVGLLRPSASRQIRNEALGGSLSDELCESTQMFHIMVPAGAQPGRRFVFPNEGDESTVRHEWGNCVGRFGC
jgi:hypothetical protein